LHNTVESDNSAECISHVSVHPQAALKQIFFWMSTNLLTLNSSKTECLVIGLKRQLSKIDNSSLNTTHSACYFGFIFDENLTFSDQVSSLSKSCYSHICQLRCIRPYLESKTASTIAASIVSPSISPRPFIPGLKLISFTNPFLHSFSDCFLGCIHGS